MPPKNWIQVKLQGDTHSQVQDLINEINKNRVENDLIRTNRDLVGIATIMRDYFEVGIASGEIQEFARKKYKSNGKA